MIVPGGGIAPDGKSWVSCKPGFFLPVRVLSRLFRRLFCEKLKQAHRTGKLAFFGAQAQLADATIFRATIAQCKATDWVVYAKRPFAGPDAVLAYLARYTHRVAIANSRLVRTDGDTVTFRYKDYRAKGRSRQKHMSLKAHEFIRRFLSHTLPPRFHRIRHYGLFANNMRKENIAKARELLEAPELEREASSDENACQTGATPRCPHCQGRMIIIETLQGSHLPRAPPGPGEHKS